MNFTVKIRDVNGAPLGEAEIEFQLPPDLEKASPNPIVRLYGSAGELQAGVAHPPANFVYVELEQVA